MFDYLLRAVRFGAVIAIAVALAGDVLVAPATAQVIPGGEDDAARCEAAEETKCAGALWHEDSQCTGLVSNCKTCAVGSGSCGGHGGHKTIAVY